VRFVARNRFGPNARRFKDYGHTMIVGPWGDVLGCADDDKAVVQAAMDAEVLARVRRQLPCLGHARLRS
jgi:nitrilase